MARFGWLAMIACACLAWASSAQAQTFGTELHNTLMPASGAMGGVSIARPQDLTSAINANPAALTQFQGTQFLFGGAWAEPTFNMSQTGQIPFTNPAIVEPFSAKSTAPGTPGGNIGVTQDLSELGLPATLGVGFVTTCGAMVDFRQVPESHGTNSGMAIFSVPVMLGVDLTDRLSVGAGVSLGIAFFDGPFVGVGGMTPDYALRGTVGMNYQLAEATTVGAYYQTQQAFRFDNAFLLSLDAGQIARDVNMDLPENFGLGFANSDLCEGSLLLACDVLLKMWDEATLYNAVYDNQLVVQVGAQYTMGPYKLRSGYVWAENPIDQSPGQNLGGIIQPGDIRAVRYSQGLLAVTGQNRISVGIGRTDLLPGLDADLMAGGMLRDTEQLGPFTTTSIESYWLGMGLTWRFGRGACCQRLPPPNSWAE